MNRNFALRIGAALLSTVLAIGCQEAQTPGNASTPELLIEKFEAAMKSGDGEAIARLVAAPGDAFIRERFRLAGEMDAARAELEKSLEKAFGPPPAGRADAFGSSLAEIVLSRASRTNDARRPKVKMTVKSQKKQLDGSVLLWVDQEFDTAGESKVKSDTITVVETKEGWKLVQPKALSPPGTDPFGSEKQAVEQLRNRAKEVAAGLFKNRSEAEDLTAIQLALLIADELGATGADSLPHLRSDAVRLRLIPNETPDAAAGIHVIVRVAAGSKPGLVRLSSGELTTEAKTDDLAKTLRHMIGSDDEARGAVSLTVLKGLPTDDLIQLLHAVVDLRPVVTQGFSMALEDPATLPKIEPQLKGRLHLAVVGMGRAPVEEAVSLDPELKLDASATPSLDDLPRSLLDPLAPSKADVEPISPKLDPLDTPPPKGKISLPDVGAPPAGGLSTGGTLTDPKKKKP